MKCTKIALGGKEFLRIELAAIGQKGKQFYVGTMAAKDLIHTYSVEPAKYDAQKFQALARQFADDAQYYEYRVTEARNSIPDQPFQRKENEPRVQEIADFLTEEEYALFPNAIIATCDLLNDEAGDTRDKFEQSAELQDLAFQRHQAFLEESDTDAVIYVPFINDVLLLIDGQHRVKGLARAIDGDEEGLRDYSLLLTFILGFDRSTIAKLFYTINYTQKSVNKSLLYQLSGEFSRDLTETTFLHEVVKLLNELEQSPFLGRVKMLGVRPPDLAADARARMTISQAFLIDYLLPTISESSKGSVYQPIFLHQFKDKNLQIWIIRVLIKYFTAVSKLDYAGWTDPTTSVISKTVSIAAFIKLLQLIFVKMFVDEFEMDPKRISEFSVDRASAILADVSTFDFSTGGPYGGISSAGTVSKLTKDLLGRLSYFPGENAAEKLANFKASYKPQFSSWLSPQ